MNTQVKEVPVCLSSEFVQMLGQTKVVNVVADGIFTVINWLLNNSSSQKVWEDASKYYQWEMFDKAVLREIYLKICDNPYSEPMIVHLMKGEVLHIEDYAKLAGFNLLSRSACAEASQAVLKVTAFYQRQEEGERIASQFIKRHKVYHDTYRHHLVGPDGMYDGTHTYYT